MEPVLKDRRIGHKSGLSRQVVFGDRLSYNAIWKFLSGISHLSRQVVSHGSAPSRQVSLYDKDNIELMTTLMQGTLYLAGNM